MKKLSHVQAAILFAAIGFLLYGRSFSFDYTNFDDNALLFDNREYISDLSNLPDAFRRTVFFQGSDIFYRPVETVWFILNAQFAGSDWKSLPAVYHFSSVLLHVIAGLLIFILLGRLRRSDASSLALSLIFLVHPVLCMAVAWVPGVVDILLTVFSISAFLFFMNFLELGRRRDYVLHLLFFILALYTKETALVLPFMCLFYHVFLFLKKTALQEIWKGLKVFLIGWMMVSVVWLIMRDYAIRDSQQKGIIEMTVSLFKNIPGIIQYIGKIFFPVNLSVMPVMQDTTFLFGIASVILLVTFVFLSKNMSKKMIGFSLLWFALFLLPTFIKTSEFRMHQFYEHRLYLPLIGLLLFLSEMDWAKRFSWTNNIYRIPAVVLIAAFVFLNFRHQQTFNDTKSFLDNAVVTAPHSSLAHRNLGIYYQDMAAKDSSLLRMAASEYRTALELNPKEKDLHNNLGVIYDTWKMRDEAEKEYLREIELNEKNSQAYHNLGVLYSEKNDFSKAEKFLKRAIELNATRSSLEQLALVYQKTGNRKGFENIAGLLNMKENRKQTTQAPPAMNPREAELALLKKVEADPVDKTALYNLGLLYYQTGRRAEAEKYWRKTVTADSTYVEAFNNLAVVLALQGKKKEAEEYLKKVLQINPDYIDGYFNLANFYAKNGNEKEALLYIKELKKRGIDKKHFGNVSPEVDRLFDRE